MLKHPDTLLDRLSEQSADLLAIERLSSIRVAENARLERIPSRNVGGPISLPALT